MGGVELTTPLPWTAGWQVARMCGCESILEQVATLDELDTADIPPNSGVLPLTNVMGDDVPRPSLDPAAVMSNVPAAEDGQFRVPAIFEDE